MTLEKLAKKIAPDYPYNPNMLDSEYCWTILASYHGTVSANQSAHGFILHLGYELNLSTEELYEKWQELEND